ncbi:MAG: hypothetical protein ACT4O2_10595 [Beijerinckiaceae bacterium]
MEIDLGYNKILDAMLVNLWSSIRSRLGGRLVTEEPARSESTADPRDPDQEKSRSQKLRYSLDRFKSDDDTDYDDDSYEAFVALMWRRPGIDLKKIPIERVWRSGEVFPAILVRLVEGQGRLYINLYERETRKTDSADSRHSWQRNGAVIDSSAFQAIKLGVAPEVALAPDPYPASYEAALEPAYNRVAAVGRAFVISYSKADGEISYRVISNVVRAADHFSARCHFRWGERRHFLYQRLLGVRDAITRETIESVDFKRNKSAAQINVCSGKEGSKTKIAGRNRRNSSGGPSGTTT